MLQRRVAVKAIIVHQNKLLVVRHHNYAGGFQANKILAVPGGGVEPGEALQTAIERELIEELGVKPLVGRLLYVQQFVHKQMEHLEFFFEITNPSDFTNIDLSKTTHGSKEIAEVLFIDPATSDILYPKFLSTEPLDPAQATTKLFSYL